MKAMRVKVIMDCNKLIMDMPSEVYHGEKNSFSSSQLKTMLQDPEVFYKKYITKELAKEEAAAFDVGTYFHTAILEPEKLDKECAVFTGEIRRGKNWDAFKAEHKGKAIITGKEKEQAELMIKAVKESPVAMKHLEGSQVEVSAFLVVYVLDNKIFTVISGAVHVLDVFFGWVFCDYMTVDSLEDFAVKIVIKVRADSMLMDQGIISDLKSTTGNCKDIHTIKEKVANYDYDLSASLYIDVFSAVTAMQFHTFAWIFASKDIGNSKTWYQDADNRIVGRSKWKRAVVLLAHYISNDWTFEDSIGILPPTFYNREWIPQPNSNLM